MQDAPQEQGFEEASAAACRLIYTLHGFESAIQFLHKVLEDKIPLSYINVISATLDMSVIVPVCSTKISGTKKTEISQLSKRPHYIKTDVPIQEYLLEDDISAYEREFAKYYQVTPDLFFVGQKSLLRIPIAQNNNWVLLIQFWSTHTGAFSEEQSMMISRILQPLMEEIALVGIDSVNTSAIASTYSTSAGYEGLLLCHDMRAILERVKKVAVTDCAVLLTGETGVGKEVVADTIHALSPRSKAPFIKVNCASLPETLIDSELFGHEKGSFTSAYAMRQGYFELADKGTLFLDEIGEMSPAAQAKLLRVLETQTFRRIGSSGLQKVDVRVIAATNRNLADMVRQGSFRRDLYYRLNSYPILIPPLRERKNDIFPLTNFFLELYAQKLGRKVPGIRQKDIALFYQYPWPGNIRELRHVVERALIDFSDEDGAKLRFELPTGPVADAGEASFRPPGGWPTLDELTRSYIEAVLQHTGGKVSGPDSASAILGIHYTTLRAHLKRMRNEAGNRGNTP